MGLISNAYNSFTGLSGGAGVYGSGTEGIYGSGSSFGVVGYSDDDNGTGVCGKNGSTSGSGSGVEGYSFRGFGGNFQSYSNYGLVARSTNVYYAAAFYGHVYSSGGFVTSDKNLKTNIHEFKDAMSIINKLKPQNYQFKNDAKYASLNLPKGSHYGLLAQDLQEVLPNLVSEAPHQLKTVKLVTAIRLTADGKPTPVIAEQKETKETINIKAVNYIELIPIIVKAMQEQEATIEKQNATIEKQNAKIEALTQLVNQIKGSNPESSVKLSGVSLGQNTPNPPIANSTRINYHIPSGSATAELIFTNAAGQKVKQVQLNRNGAGIINIDTSSLRSCLKFIIMLI